MHRKNQLETILNRKTAEAVEAYLRGDWSQLADLFKMPQASFNQWADSIELPYEQVTNKHADSDGIFVLADSEGWIVFQREDGVHVSGERMYANYKLAKRAALGLYHFNRLERPTSKTT